MHQKVSVRFTEFILLKRRRHTWIFGYTAINWHTISSFVIEIAEWLHTDRKWLNEFNLRYFLLLGWWLVLLSSHSKSCLPYSACVHVSSSLLHEFLREKGTRSAIWRNFTFTCCKKYFLSGLIKPLKSFVGVSVYGLSCLKLILSWTLSVTTCSCLGKLVLENLGICTFDFAGQEGKALCWCVRSSVSVLAYLVILNIVEWGSSLRGWGR